MRPSTERIGKDIRASSNFFTRRAADVVYEGYFTAMTGYRHDEPAMHDGHQHDRNRSDIVMICMNFNIYASLAFITLNCSKTETLCILIIQ